jgi:hypothetical protein
VLGGEGSGSFCEKDTAVADSPSLNVVAAYGLAAFWEFLAFFAGDKDGQW